MTQTDDARGAERVCDWCDETSLQRKARCPVKGCGTRADMAHPLAALIAGVKVKPLEWEESLIDRWIGTPVIKLGDLAFWIFRHHDGAFKRTTKDGWQFHLTLDAAKAAAQADYAARIEELIEEGSVMAQKLDAAEAKLAECEARLEKAVEALDRLVALNDDYSPFGGELLQDRVERTWQKARTTLKELKGKDT